MKNKGDPPFSGTDAAAETRHQDTIGMGVMSMATVVLIGMFGLLEVAGTVDSSQVTDEGAKSTETFLIQGDIPAPNVHLARADSWALEPAFIKLMAGCYHLWTASDSDTDALSS